VHAHLGIRGGIEKPRKKNRERPGEVTGGTEKGITPGKKKRKRPGLTTWRRGVGASKKSEAGLRPEGLWKKNREEKKKKTGGDTRTGLFNMEEDRDLVVEG